MTLSICIVLAKRVMHAYVAQEFEDHFRPLLALLGAKVGLSELETGAASFDENQCQRGGGI